MMVTMLQSTNQVETFSAMRAVISAPFGRRDVYGRMLAPELGISKASALLPVTMPTHRAQNLHNHWSRSAALSMRCQILRFVLTNSVLPSSRQRAQLLFCGT
jgi:hypothetical protein